MAMAGIKDRLDGESIYPEGMYSLLDKAQAEYAVKRAKIEKEISRDASPGKEEYFFDLATQYLKLMDFLFDRLSRGDLSPISIIAMFNWAHKLGYDEVSTKNLEVDFDQVYREYTYLDHALKS